MRIALRRIRERWPGSEAPVFIFDCNGVLVDSELIAATVTAEELARVGFSVSPEIVAGFFAGRRPSDMLAEVEAATDRKLPKDFAVTLAATMLRRLRAELRPTAHVDHALTWLRGPKCVASASPIDRIRMSLETTGLLRFFTPYLFSASEVPRGKPAPDLFLHAAAKMQVAAADCIVVEEFAGWSFGRPCRRDDSGRLHRRQSRPAPSRRATDRRRRPRGDRRHARAEKHRGCVARLVATRVRAPQQLRDDSGVTAAPAALRPVRQAHRRLRAASRASPAVSCGPTRARRPDRTRHKRCRSRCRFPGAWEMSALLRYA